MKLIDKAIEQEQSASNPFARTKQEIIKECCPKDYGLSNAHQYNDNCGIERDCIGCWEKEVE